MMALKYSEILKGNALLAKNLTGEAVHIALLSNVTINQLKEIFEFRLRSSQINAQVTVGNFDNIVQDSQQAMGKQVVVVFWELANLVPLFQARAHVMTEQELSLLLERVTLEITMTLQHLKNTPLVLFNLFSALPFAQHHIRPTAYELFCQKLNDCLLRQQTPNLVLVSLDKLFGQVGIKNSMDWRFFYAAKAPYTLDFFKAWADHCAPAVLAMAGKTKKALICDCDNTLWHGVVGEEGPEHIKMNADSEPGIFFYEAQLLAKGLLQQGILLGLNSKNNPQDVNEVFVRHHDKMPLSGSDFVIKKINWQDKATNLRQIATELNIGLDSLVFLDDSDFEINLVREQVPEVTALRVPDKKSDYPSFLREHFKLFFGFTQTNEDKNKAQMYQQELARKTEADQHASLDDYLASLGLVLTIHVDNKDMTARISQMTQKTNQFNVTTKRYTETEIKQCLESEAHKVIAFEVRDRFGDSGITGLCLVELAQSTAFIDTLLMSCRVLGRKLEYAFFDNVIALLRDQHIAEVRARYCPTPKNAQVADLFDRLGFAQCQKTETETCYKMATKDYKPFNLKSIQVTYGSQQQTQ